MFTGIVECEGKITEMLQQDHALNLTIESPISPELKIDQSVAHNGICLTVTALNGKTHTVCAVEETIRKTTIARWKPGDFINLERGMKLNDRLDGHLVQGHVDTKAICIQRSGTDSNRIFRFSIPQAFSHLIIEKGSVCINGTSLTCFHVSDTEFDIAVIPYTFDHTTLRFVHESDEVNVEFDLIGKYILRSQQTSGLKKPF